MSEYFHISLSVSAHRCSLLTISLIHFRQFVTLAIDSVLILNTFPSGSDQKLSYTYLETHFNTLIAVVLLVISFTKWIVFMKIVKKMPNRNMKALFNFVSVHWAYNVCRNCRDDFISAFPETSVSVRNVVLFVIYALSCAHREDRFSVGVCGIVMDNLC